MFYWEGSHQQKVRLTYFSGRGCHIPRAISLHVFEKAGMYGSRANILCPGLGEVNFCFLGFGQIEVSRENFPIKCKKFHIFNSLGKKISSSRL